MKSVKKYSLTLPPRQWAVVWGHCAAAYVLLPWLYGTVVRFNPTANYRVPYALSGDIWNFRRQVHPSDDTAKRLVLGDSFVWGHYVKQDETLSCRLNQLAGEGVFSNLGRQGLHPAAQYGLLRTCEKDLRERKILLCFNPLWLSSPRHNLRESSEGNINHPALLPQFGEDIPAYQAKVSIRLERVLMKSSSFLQWTAHIRQRYYNNAAPPVWTLKHPDDHPQKPLLEQADIENDTTVISIEKKHSPRMRQNYPWVMPEESLQWAFFLRTAELLRQNENAVFIMITPWCRASMTDTNHDVFLDVLAQIEISLKTDAVPYFISPALPAELFADQSHPTAAGYAVLAEALSNNEAFQRWSANSIASSDGR